MSLRADLEQAMVDARHEAIGHPSPDFCMCRAEEYAGEMSEGVAKFVADWIRRMAEVAGYGAGEFWLEAAWRDEMSL